MNKQAVLSLSGGMDSSTVLLHLLANGYEVTALSFDYGQKHKIELERAQQLVNYINLNRLTEPNVKYGVIKLDGLAPMLNSALVEGGDEVPEGHYEEDNMKATVVPNRNKIFASLVQAVALSESNANGLETDIALGIHAGDHAIYPDCRQEFRDADYNAFIEGNWDSDKVTYYKNQEKIVTENNSKAFCSVSNCKPTANNKTIPMHKRSTRRSATIVPIIVVSGIFSVLDTMAARATSPPRGIAKFTI